MNIRSYRSPEAFKQALERKLRESSASSLDLGRQRQLVVFGRFLARIERVFGEHATLKGGLVLEIRIKNARTTKDIDLRISTSADKLLEQMILAAKLDAGDFMVFELWRDATHPHIQNEGMTYDGQRFRAQCQLAGKMYGQPFGVDVAFGDPMVGSPELIVGADSLAFAGISPPTIRVYPIETHIAEKFHAYTLPRSNTNSRVKDLPDIALLATIQPIVVEVLSGALRQTFQFRKSHELPRELPLPPASWEAPFARMAEENSLPWTSLKAVTQAAQHFLDPVLALESKVVWDPTIWRWT